MELRTEKEQRGSDRREATHVRPEDIPPEGMTEEQSEQWEQNRGLQFVNQEVDPALQEQEQQRRAQEDKTRANIAEEEARSGFYAKERQRAAEAEEKRKKTEQATSGTGTARGQGEGQEPQTLTGQQNQEGPWEKFIRTSMEDYIKTRGPGERRLDLASQRQGPVGEETASAREKSKGKKCRRRNRKSGKWKSNARDTGSNPQLGNPSIAQQQG